MDVYLYRKYDVSISDMSIHFILSLDASVGVLRRCKSLVLATPICTLGEASSTLHMFSRGFNSSWVNILTFVSINWYEPRLVWNCVNVQV